MQRKPITAFALLAACAMTQVALAAPPGVRYVRAEAPDGGNGQSWATAYNLVRAALAEAEASGGAVTEIWVKEGSYRPLYIIPEGAALTFTLVDGVGLYGGFAGTETARDQRDPAAHLTILNGDLGGFYVTSTVTTAGDASALLDGFTISHNGAHSGAGVGGAGNSTIRNCIITGNAVGMVLAGAPTVVDCLITGNSPPAFAGGTAPGAGVNCNPGSSPTFINCTISDNHAGGAWGTPAPLGAGAYVSNASAYMIGCTIRANVTGRGGFGICQGGVPGGGNPGGPGGGLYLQSASALLESCTIAENFTGSAIEPPTCVVTSAPGTRSGNGAGIYALNSALLAVNCAIVGNQTSKGGPGGSAFGSAYAGGDSGNGGGVWASGGSVDLVNCTLADNATGEGGDPGRADPGTPAGIRGARGNGAGVFGDAHTRLENCIIWDDLTAPASEIAGPVGIVYSDVQAGYAGTGNIAANPLFADAAGGDYRLTATSPCIDAGNSSPATGTLPATDLDGLARRVDIASVPDTGVGAPVVDMGAYEVQICIADLNGDGLIDFADYLEFLNLYDATDPRADFNGDGLVDFADYLEFLNLYDAGC